MLTSTRRAAFRTDLLLFGFRPDQATDHERAAIERHGEPSTLQTFAARLVDAIRR
jgi:hypothetical protein